MGTALGLALGVFVGVLVLAAALSPFVQPGEEQGLVPDRSEPSRAAPFVANAIVVIVFAPITEELAFRGLGYTLLERFGEWAAIVLVGIGLRARPRPREGGVPPPLCVRCRTSLLRARTTSVYPPMLLHATFNAVALIGSVAT